MKKKYYLFQAFGCIISNTKSISYIFSKVTLLIFFTIILSTKMISAQSGPNIVVWYGDEQSFGQQGVPQPWINILGNVSDVNAALSYTLNSGSNVTLSIGPDSRRLQSSGDFNIDLATVDLIDGVNTVIITAINDNGQTVHPVIVNYTSTNIWPLPYNIDWQSKAAINDVSQAVDGNWEITPDGIHTVTTGYDRLVAIGEQDWDDYEVSVPITIHSINNGNGVGVLLRWPGHSINGGASCDQPKCGYLPLGVICWYTGSRLELYGNDGHILATQTRSLTTGTTYIFKARVESNPGVGGYYSFKVWEQGGTEPDEWDLTAQEKMTDPLNGSLLLISHHADVTFGNVAITPIPISITNVQALVHSNNTSVTISWDTTVPANSQVSYGLTSAYELGSVTDATLKTSHSVELTGLLPNTEYHYQISSSTDGAEDNAITGDRTFNTKTSNIVSDDFNDPILDESIWTFIDPENDGGYSLTGTCSSNAWINISVPSGSSHELWVDGIVAPHILQSSNDADFDLEVKFESSVSDKYQEQGILVKQDDANFLRFEFYSDGSNTYVIAAAMTGPGFPLSPNIIFNGSIGAVGISPLYMRVNRSGNQWTQSYSSDGTNWTAAADFAHTLIVTEVGTYAGNAGSNPAHTSSIDYFFNTASPISSEDGSCTEWIGTSSNDWDNDGNWSFIKPDQNMNAIIPALKSEYPLLSGSGSCSNLIIETGATLDINTDGELSINGIFQNNGGLTIHSAASGTGSLIDNGFISGTGTALVERFMNDADWTTWNDGWHLLSSPVAAQAISPNFVAAPITDYDFYCWNEPTNQWINYKNQSGGGGTAPFFDLVNGSNNFEVGKGYMAAYNNDDTKSFTGKLNNGDVTITGLNITGDVQTNRSWHLLGNPFPSGLIWYTDWTTSNIAGTAQIWNESNKSYSAIIAGNTIPATNGFMVQATADGASLTIPKAKRTHGGTFYKSIDFPIIKLKANNLDYPSAQESQLLFNPNSTNEWDMEYDGDFLVGYAPYFYSKIDGQPMAVNSMPYVEETTTIPFTFIKNEGLNFSIEMYEVENMPMNVWLWDKKLNKDHNLTIDPVYIFTSNEQDDSERYVIHFSPLGTSDNISDINNVQIWSSNRTIHIENNQKLIGEITLYNLMGQQLVQNTLTGETKQEMSLNVRAGLYIVNINHIKGNESRKVIIR